MTVDGVRRATIDDVARLAGVHKGTVSRALNASTRHIVSAATVERVERAAAELGYVANPMARGLRTRSSMTIGVVIPDLTNPFFPPIVRGIEERVLPRGYTVLLANTEGSEEIERAALASLLGRRVDGLVIASGVQHPQSPLTEVVAAGVPAIMVNRDAGEVPFPVVAGDDEQGIADAVAHLVGLGHRDLLHVAGPGDTSTGAIRAAAFVAVCRSLGVAGRVLEAPAMSVAGGRESMDLVVAGGAVPTGVVAANDLIAVGVLRSLREHGLSCPADVSVVGYNDIPFAEDLAPALTSVRVPMLEMGREAADVLLERIVSGERSPFVRRLPVEMVVRDSTAPPRA